MTPPCRLSLRTPCASYLPDADDEGRPLRVRVVKRLGVLCLRGRPSAGGTLLPVRLRRRALALLPCEIGGDSPGDSCTTIRAGSVVVDETISGAPRRRRPRGPACHHVGARYPSLRTPCDRMPLSARRIAVFASARATTDGRVPRLGVTAGRPSHPRSGRTTKSSRRSGHLLAGSARAWCRPLRVEFGSDQERAPVGVAAHDARAADAVSGTDRHLSRGVEHLEARRESAELPAGQTALRRLPSCRINHATSGSAGSPASLASTRPMPRQAPVSWDRVLGAAPPPPKRWLVPDPRLARSRRPPSATTSQATPSAPSAPRAERAEPVVRDCVAHSPLGMIT